MFDSPLSSLRALAFYLPQFHPTPENDAFWGKGFTEWRNVVAARPAFKGHEQPHLPADLGFYDLRLEETRIAQAELARAAGLHGFCYYHYWFAGRRLLHRPLDDMLQTGTPDFPFMLCWANENWTRAWDGGPREVIVAQEYSDADTIAHARHLAPVFADPRYLRIDDRPVFAVYCADDLPDPRRWTDLFRKTCLNQGKEPYLLRIERHFDRDLRPPAALGFDAAVDFQPFSRSFLNWQCQRPDLKAAPARRLAHRLRRERARYQAIDTHHDMAAFVDFDLSRPLPDYVRFPGVCPSWDNSARRPPGKRILFRNTDPALFEHWASETFRRFTPPTPDENLVFINAWNEWAEGNHLEPCLRHGHGWLTALRRALDATCIRSAHAAAR